VKSEREPPRPFGVYVHFPYCAMRCPYCDFAVAVEPAIPQARYTRAILDELELRGAPFRALACRSLYLGGGTPSLWDPESVAEVVAAVRDRLGLEAGAEVTLEANPESCEPWRLAAYRDAGVNRFSIGVQSFDAGVLAKLGRRHRPADAERAVRAAAEVVENVAVDLIYGARRSTPATARADAERAAALPVTHVSAYALTVDAAVLGDETPFARLARAGRLPLPADGDVVAQASAMRAALRRAGLRRYEISNYARPGFASIHNALYWASESYLGVGAGAFGCLHGPGRARRWGNLRDAARWMAAVEAGRLPLAEEEELGPRELEEERLLLALRTRRGLSMDEIAPAKRGEAARLVRTRLAAIVQGRLVLTSRGMELHSAVVERLLP
jgi:putative oxygen-independent coproporphyrinogen III oxidase